MLTSKKIFGKKSTQNLREPETLCKLHNPIKLIDQGREALHMYCDAIGVDYISDDRHFNQSQPRMAFGVALTRHIGDSLTSDVLEKDRTTIIHYKRKHESNLQWWDGYKTMFETAEYVVDSYFNEMAKLNRIDHIDSMISKLVNEKKLIQSQTNV